MIPKPDPAALTVTLGDKPVDVDAIFAHLQKALGRVSRPERQMSEEDLQRKIRRQMDRDFRSNPRKAFEQHGLTRSLHRGVVRAAIAAAVVLACFLIWTAFHH